jgi:hypothetical protein
LEVNGNRPNGDDQEKAQAGERRPNLPGHNMEGLRIGFLRKTSLDVNPKLQKLRIQEDFSPQTSSG